VGAILIKKAKVRSVHAMTDVVEIAVTGEYAVLLTAGPVDVLQRAIIIFVMVGVKEILDYIFYI